MKSPRTLQDEIRDDQVTLALMALLLSGSVISYLSVRDSFHRSGNPGKRCAEDGVVQRYCSDTVVQMDIKR